jgi:hypothetical protein
MEERKGRTGLPGMSWNARAILFLLIFAAACTVEEAGPSGPTPSRPLPSAAGSVVQPSPTFEQTPENNRVVATIVSGRQPIILGVFPSPDESASASIIVYPCEFFPDLGRVSYEALQLQTGRSLTTADDRLINCDGLGAYGLQGLFWSANGEYFYYEDGREGGPDGCGYWKPPYLRLDRATGLTESLGIGSLSPDGSRLATRNDGSISVVEVGGPGRVQVPLPQPSLAGGPIAWSPDGEAFILLLDTSACPVEHTYVYLVELGPVRLNLILDSTAPAFSDAQWADPDRVRLLDASGDPWSLDLLTATLSPGQN